MVHNEWNAFAAVVEVWGGGCGGATGTAVLPPSVCQALSAD